MSIKNTQECGRRISRGLTLPELLLRLGTRAEVECLIQGLIDALDEADGDSDSEPDLGSISVGCNRHDLDQTHWAFSGTDDREADLVVLDERA